MNNHLRVSRTLAREVRQKCKTRSVGLFSRNLLRSMLQANSVMEIAVPKKVMTRYLNIYLIEP